MGQGLWEGKSLRERASPVGTLPRIQPLSLQLCGGKVRVSYRGKGGGFGSVETNRRVEKAAIEFVRRRYEQDGWSVRSVEAEKVGCDLCCERADEQVHLEVKGTQADSVCFIITAAEVRNAMIDRRHLTCVVTAALTPVPKMFTYSRDDFSKKIQLAKLAKLDLIAFRAQALSE